jgi:enoyl-CoA hydratase/carnithine racemase
MTAEKMSATAGTPTYETIRYDVTDRVATITLNRPDKLNALNRDLIREVATAMRAADEDPEVRCIILTGAGRAFCSGGDISGERASDTAWDQYLFLNRPPGSPRINARDIHKPMIAAVNGMCYGGGLITAMVCDFVISSDRASYCMIEARMGSTGIETMPFHTGPQWAKIMMLTGEIISAKRAERIGVVALVVPHDTLMARAMAFAKRIAAMPRYGVMLNKANIDGTMDMMGWLANERFSRAHGSVTLAMGRYAEASDGRPLRSIIKTDGLRAFIEARDAAFTESLFKDEEL